MSSFLKLLSNALLAIVVSNSVMSLGIAQESAPDAEAAETGDLGTAANVAMDTDLSSELERPDIILDELGLRLSPLTRTELADLAVRWRRIIKAKTNEAVEVQIAIARAGDSATDEARAKAIALVKDRNDLLDRYALVIDAWERKGGEEAAIEEFHTYQRAIRTQQIKAADPKTIVVAFWDWLTSADGGGAVAQKIALIAIGIYTLHLAASLAERFAAKRIDRVPRASKLLQYFFVNVIYWIVLSFGLMFLLTFFGVDITPLFALVGGASFILGFAFQDTLGNFASGLMIMVNRPFDQGDFVDVSGVTGTVGSVNMVATTVITLDNRVIVIPNKQVWGNVITNRSARKARRVDMVFGIGYGDDIPEAISVLREAVEAHPLVLKKPKPLIVVKELGDNSVNLLCGPWTKSENYLTVFWDLMADVKMRFDAAGISIPFPQRDVHLHTLSGAPGVGSDGKVDAIGAKGESS